MHTSPLWGQTEIPMDTKEQTKLKPLLSYDEANCEDGHGIYVRDFYEAKITSGELAVVNTILRSELNMHIRRNHNIAWDAAGAAWVTHCAGCGAKIVKP